MPPTVSFVIPAYNAASTIRATIESVLRQTYRDFEVLVVDDGSTDETASIVRSFGPDVRNLYQPNQGLAAARNTGIRATTGKVLVLLDADDMWLPDLLERQMVILSARSEIDGVFAWAQFIDEQGAPLPDQMRTRLNGEVLRSLLLGGNGVLFSMLAVRRTVFEKVGLFDPVLRQAQDWDMMLRMATSGVRLACIPQALVLRRLHARNVSAAPGGSLRWERAVLDKAFATLPMPEHYRALAARAHFNVLHRAAMAHWRRGDRQMALSRFAEGLTIWPEGLRYPQTYIAALSRLQPVGYRSRAEILAHLDPLARQLEELLRALLTVPEVSLALRRSRGAAWSALHAALATFFAQNRSWDRALVHAVKSGVLRPGLALEVVGDRLRRSARRLRLTVAPVRIVLGQHDSDPGQSLNRVRR